MDIATELMINEEIRDREVRLIDENGEQLGVMPMECFSFPSLKDQFYLSFHLKTSF